MKPCPKCGQQPTVTIHSPWWFELVGSVHVECCGYRVCGDGVADAKEAWNKGPEEPRIGEVTSL